MTSKGDEHPLHVPWDGTGFLDDLHLADKASIRCVDLDQVRFADASLFNELEPVSSGSVQRLAFSRNQRGMI